MRRPDPAVVHRVGLWLDRAEEDLRLAEYAFTMASSPPYRLIAYHAQQCAEKLLKALLLFHGVDFPYTHNISRLLELVPASSEWTGSLREAEELTPYSITARYPGRDEPVTEAEARRAAEVARRVREAVKEALVADGFEPAGAPSY